MADAAGIEIRWDTETGDGHWIAYVGQGDDVYLELWRWPGDDGWGLTYAWVRVADDGWEKQELNFSDTTYVEERSHLRRMLDDALGEFQQLAERADLLRRPWAALTWPG